MIRTFRTTTVLIVALTIGVVLLTPVFAGGSRERESDPDQAPSSAESSADGPSVTDGGEIDEAVIAEMREILSEMGIQTFRSSIDAVDFSLPLLSGGTRSLSEMTGEFVFLNFWATWCPPCREEMPSMEVLYREMADAPFGMFAVNVQEDRDTVQQFIDEFGYTYPILLDSDGTLSSNYGVRGIPTSFFIAPDGTVLGMLIGTRYWDETEVVDGIRRITEITAEL
jgi:thiol-disulfide isomerase/thioredoxin